MKNTSGPGRYLGYVYYGFRWLLGLYRPPDRQFLEGVILPHYASRRDIERILFVGVRSYVSHYQDFFLKKRFVTIDPVPYTRWFGSTFHVVDKVENLEHYFDEGTFDLIVLNGVIGWGLDELESIEKAFRACHSCLREQGEFVIGFNEKCVREDLSLEIFEPVKFQGIGHHRHEVATPLPEGSHTYLFYRKPGNVSS